MQKQDPRLKNVLPEADTPKAYLGMYMERLAAAMAKVPEASLTAAFQLIRDAAEKNGRIYVGGNGGSAAIADHLLCDWTKAVAIAGKPNLRVHTLFSSLALNTAIANDYGYEHTLAFPLELMADRGDLVVLISSSGNSPNIVRALEAARAKGVKVIGLSGFSGGKLKEMADVSLHVPVDNYGMVEDAHQMIMHSLAQLLLKVRSQ